MIGIKRIYTPFSTPQWIFLVLGLIMLVSAGFLGIADHPPGIALLMGGIACLAGIFIWHWRSPKLFWMLAGVTILAFPVGVLLHNLLYALGTVVSRPAIITGLIEFLGVGFFLIAVVLVPPVLFVSLVGGIAVSWSGVRGLIRRNRSYRRFFESLPVAEQTLTRLIELARMSSSVANRQVLRYVLSSTPERNQQIFPTLGWAGYLPDWPGPAEGEKPAGYILVLADRERGPVSEYDAGIAAENILLGAAEKGLGGCIIASIKKEQLCSALGIPPRYQLLLVIALGVPREKVVLDPLDSEGDIQYWRDEQGIHHVPKRPLEDLILDLD